MNHHTSSSSSNHRTAIAHKHHSQQHQQQQQHQQPHQHQSTIFLQPLDLAICLYSSATIFPVSLFILISTVNRITIGQPQQAVTLYILGVKITTGFTGLITAIISHSTALFHPQKLPAWILMIAGILASFGSMMSISTIFFKSNWANHQEAMRHIMLLIAEIILMLVSMLLSIKLALRFKIPNEFSSCTRGYSSPWSCSPSSLNYHLSIAGILTAALVLLGSITAFLGFILGVYVNIQLLRENTITGGGLYSGFLGVLTSSLLILTEKLCKLSQQRISLQLVLILGLLTVVACVISFVTEQIELTTTIEFIKDNPAIFNDYINYKIILLSKSTLVEIVSLFMGIFLCPLILTVYLRIVSINHRLAQAQAASDNKHNATTSLDLIQHNKNSNSRMLTHQLPPLLNLDSIELSAITHTTSALDFDND